MQNNYNNYEQVINIYFRQTNTGSVFVFQSHPNEKIKVLIDKYREKANDYNDNYFIFNNRRLNDLPLSIKELSDGDLNIIVDKKGNLKGANFGNKTLNIKYD